MKRTRAIVVLLMIVAAAVVIFSIYSFTPKKYAKTLDGVYYQLGTEGIIEHVKVELDGKIQRHVNGKRTFEGTIHFIGSKVPQIPENRTPLELIYDGQNFSTVFSAFRTIDDEGRVEPDIHTYGWIYANDKFSEFTIKILDDNGQFSSTNGHMITAPAKDKAEAMKKSQELIRNYENKK